MRFFEGRLTELRLDESEETVLAWIACAPHAIPAPGRYTMAWVKNGNDWLATPLFSARSAQDGFLAAPPIPSGWIPGEKLSLRGPLGRGFKVPSGTRRLALASLWSGPARLLPLVALALKDQAAVALFIDSPTPELPTAVEVNPLNALREALYWADFLALDLPLDHFHDLRGQLGLDDGVSSLSVPAQVLVSANMPCAGVADCGACALPAGKRMKLACKHGPVFDIEELLHYAG